MTEKAEKSADDRTFIDVLEDLEGGTLNRELTDALRKVVEAVREQRKPGSINISLVFGASGRGMIAVATKVTVKAPEADRLGTTFFATPGNMILRDDPAQAKLPLNNPAQGPPGALRVVE